MVIIMGDLSAKVGKEQDPLNVISPEDGTSNQIDYLTINERYRNSVTQVKSYPGQTADVMTIQ